MKEASGSVYKKFMDCGEQAIPSSERTTIVQFPESNQPKQLENKRSRIIHNSGNNEWNTPQEFIEAAREVMGSIDCDPASTEEANRTVKAETFYTKEQDGLLHNWYGNVWMNPPYSQPLIGQFCHKLIEGFESDEIRQACVLVNNGTETKWFQELLANATAVCFPRRRIRFLHGNGGRHKSPLQGQVIFYFGPEERGQMAFSRCFKRFGSILLSEAYPLDAAA